jgi:hypothetical protein
MESNDPQQPTDKPDRNPGSDPTPTSESVSTMKLPIQNANVLQPSTLLAEKVSSIPTPFSSFSDTNLGLTQEINDLSQTSFLVAKNYLEKSASETSVVANKVDKVIKRKRENLSTSDNDSDSSANSSAPPPAKLNGKQVRFTFQDSFDGEDISTLLHIILSSQLMNNTKQL